MPFAEGKKPEDNAITRKDGSPVGDFRKAWRTLCICVGLGKMLCRACGKFAAEGKCECGSQDLKYNGLLIHDLRRTSFRNLRRLDLAEKTIHGNQRSQDGARLEALRLVDESDLAAVARNHWIRKREQQQSKETSQLGQNSASSSETPKRDSTEIARIQ